MVGRLGWWLWTFLRIVKVVDVGQAGRRELDTRRDEH
jgi:hypothetical protein